MPTLTPALAARRSEITTIRTPRTGSTHALSDTLDMMGAPMSFSRNEEIWRGRTRRLSLQGRERHGPDVPGAQ